MGGGWVKDRRRGRDGEGEGREEKGDSQSSLCFELKNSRSITEAKG